MPRSELRLMPRLAPGFFVPGLTDEALIGRLCESVSLPVNIMVTEGVPSNTRLAELGVSRISYGPIPYIEAMSALKEQAKRVDA
jgi:2-methylisocitrate lyase-like PEP mutase family enzyme